jgi:hypothetical protein
MTKTKIALAVVLFAATSSAALAQTYDPNLANRYPGYAEPNTYGYSATGKLGALQTPAIQSAQVSRKKQHSNVHRQAPGFEQRDVALPTAGAAGSNDWFEIERSDRASSPFAGGN